MVGAANNCNNAAILFLFLNWVRIKLFDILLSKCHFVLGLCWFDNLCMVLYLEFFGRWQGTCNTVSYCCFNAHFLF